MNNESDLIPQVELNRLIQLSRDECSSGYCKVTILTDFIEIRKKELSTDFAQSQKISNTTLEFYYTELDYERTPKREFPQK